MTAANTNDSASAEAAAAVAKDEAEAKTKLEQKKTCDGYIDSALRRNPTIQFLLKNLVDMGCQPPEGFIRCDDCQGKQVSGGFGMLQEEEIIIKSSDDGDDNKQIATSASSTTIQKQRIKAPPDCTKSRQEIIEQFQRERDGKTKLTLKPEIYLCQEHMTSSKHANTILSHELIHAIDMCRAKLDPLKNCMQLACTEIRAENLSGECDAKWELMRGRLSLNPSKMLGHGQQCVRRRAIDSVKANPNCTSKASLYVDAAMERCYKDTFPYERHPNLR